MKESRKFFTCFILAFYLFQIITNAQTPFASINVVKQDCSIDGISYNIEMTHGYYPNSAITYKDNVSNAINGLFIVNDNASNVYSFNVPTNIHVRDFEQVDDQNMFVFCGYENVITGQSAHYEGILGWFKPDPTSVDYYIIRFPDVEVFDKVVGYVWNSKKNLVASGRHKNTVWIQDIIYVEDITFSTNTINTCNHKITQGQVLSEIVKTKNYLVFIGTRDGLYLRREEYDFMCSGPELSNYYYFPTVGVTPVSTPLATFLGNTLNRQNNAVAVNIPVMPDGLNTFESHIYTFDIFNMTMTHAQKFLLHEKTSPWGISYIENIRGLAVLNREDPNTGAWATPLIFLDPYPTTAYTANYFLDPESDYNTVDNLNYSVGNVKHLLMGKNIASGYRWTLRSGMCGSNIYSPCNDPKFFNILLQTKSTYSKYTECYSSTNSLTPYIETIISTNHSPNSPYCVH